MQCPLANTSISGILLQPQAPTFSSGMGDQINWWPTSLVRLGSQRKVARGHGLEMPHTGSRLAKSLVPLALQIKGDAPSHLVIAESHAHKVPALAGLRAVDKSRAAVEDRQVVDEVHVTWLRGELELGRLGNVLDGIQGLNLASSERGQVGWSSVARASHQSSPAKVGDETAILVEENRSALELGQSKRPVRSSQGADEVGSSSSEHIVNCVGRGDDALATRLGRVSGEPADDVSSFLVVKRDGRSGVAMVLGLFLARVVGNDVNQHVTLLVLTTEAIGNVSLDSQVDGRHILDRVLLGVESSENGKPFTLVNVLAHALEHVGTNSGKREVVRSGEIAVEFQSFEVLESGVNLLKLLGIEVMNEVRLLFKLLTSPCHRRSQDGRKAIGQSRHLCEGRKQLELLVRSNKLRVGNNGTGHCE